MKKINFKILIITTLVTLIPMLTGTILMSRFPEKMPIHFNAAGVADGFASKPIAIFGLPLFLAAMNLIVIVATTLDPDRKNNSDKLVSIFFWLIPVISNIAVHLTYSIALGYKINITMIILLLVGVMIVIIGNYLPKVNQNKTVGIKTPWTLSDDTVWFKTHRLAGRIFFVSGFLIILLAFVQLAYSMLASTIALVIIVTIDCVIPIAYSYVLYSKLDKTEDKPEIPEETENK